MYARHRHRAHPDRHSLKKSRRRYQPSAEAIESLMLMSVFDDISSAFTTLGNDIENVANEVGNAIVSTAEQAESAVVSTVQQAASTVSSYGQQLLSSVVNEGQQIQSTVSMGLEQASSVFMNLFSTANTAVSNAVSTAVTQVTNLVTTDIPQITGQVSSELQNVYSVLTTNTQLAQQDISNALQTATTTLAGGFQQVGSTLATAVTDPHVEAGLSYSLDGLLILGGVALCATSVVDGPAGDIAGASLIGAGVAGISYNAQHSNADGSVSGSFSWSTYGENLGIGAATGLITGGASVGSAAVAPTLGLAGSVLVGAGGGAASGALGQLLTNAVNSQALTNNLGEATGFGALAGGVFSALGSALGSKSSSYLSDLKSSVVGDSTTTISSLPSWVDSGGFRTASKFLLGDALKATVTGLGGPQAVATQLGTSLSTIDQILGMGSDSGSMAVTPQMFVSDLHAVFAADPTQASTGFVQSVTSVALPNASGTALVGIGGDNYVYVDEVVPGSGSTGWVFLGGPMKQVSVTTGLDGLPTIFGLSPINNTVYVNQQQLNG
jgi:hypothetical protein